MAITPGQRQRIWSSMHANYNQQQYLLWPKTVSPVLFFMKCSEIMDDVTSAIQLLQSEGEPLCSQHHTAKWKTFRRRLFGVWIPARYFVIQHPSHWVLGCVCLPCYPFSNTATQLRLHSLVVSVLRIFETICLSCIVPLWIGLRTFLGMIPHIFEKVRPVLCGDQLFSVCYIIRRKNKAWHSSIPAEESWPRCYETLSQELITNLAPLHGSENGDISIQALALERTKRWRWEERRGEERLFGCHLSGVCLAKPGQEKI